MSLPENRAPSTDPAAFDDAALREMKFDGVPKQVEPNDPPPTPIGNLGQAQRLKQIQEARSIFFIVGTLTILMNTYSIYSSEQKIDKMIAQRLHEVEGDSEVVVDRAELARFKAMELERFRNLHAIFLGLGILFVVLGVNIRRAPVAITLSGLVIYVGLYAYNSIGVPIQFHPGQIVQLLIVAGFLKALFAAIAYRKEAKYEPVLS